ncbi:DUF1885 family protein [Thermicanus aegyptius]|uniref:DUF1885 family protein n=1 Tax=Thermicanus aegyptius TaxID=94009 RepID=UPI0004132F78|nr:DUF1885 family protein [Thermicanus aegyptius]
MPQSAYIKILELSKKERLTLEELKGAIEHYIEMTTKTGEQLDWGYEKAAFPYTLEMKGEGEKHWFYLKGKNPNLYRVILVGLGETEDGKDVIQITLPDPSTHGDKGKANELSRYLAKHFKAELTLFNGRIQSFL